jgi:hypothetical protein
MSTLWPRLPRTSLQRGHTGCTRLGQARQQQQLLLLLLVVVLLVMVMVALMRMTVLTMMLLQMMVMHMMLLLLTLTMLLLVLAALMRMMVLLLLMMMMTMGVAVLMVVLVVVLELLLVELYHPRSETTTKLQPIVLERLRRHACGVPPTLSLRQRVETTQLCVSRSHLDPWHQSAARSYSRCHCDSHCRVVQAGVVRHLHTAAWPPTLQSLPSSRFQHQSLCCPEQKQCRGGHR